MIEVDRNGERITARTYESLLNALRRREYFLFSSTYEYRQDLIWRAKVWSGMDLEPDMSAEELIKKLAELGFWQIVHEEGLVHASK